MSTQRVNRQERLGVVLNIKAPDLNRGKSYKDANRRYNIFLDGEFFCKIDYSTPSELKLPFRLRSLLEIKKVYGTKRPDSIFTYRIGENFAELENQSGARKRIALDFTEGNILNVEDDYSFRNLVDIKK